VVGSGVEATGPSTVPVNVTVEVWTRPIDQTYGSGFWALVSRVRVQRHQVSRATGRAYLTFAVPGTR